MVNVDHKRDVPTLAVFQQISDSRVAQSRAFNPVTAVWSPERPDIVRGQRSNLEITIWN